MLADDFRILEYVSWSADPSRVMVAVRLNLYVVQYVPGHDDKKYVCLTMKHGKYIFSLVARHVPPRTVDE